MSTVVSTLDFNVEKALLPGSECPQLCVPSWVRPRLRAVYGDSDFYSLEFLSLIVFKLPLLFVKDTDVWPWRKTR